MSYLYVTENGATLGVNGGSIVLTHLDKQEERIPKESVTGISLLGQVQMTPALIRFCLQNDIKTSFMSQNGTYYGSLAPAQNTDAKRLKQQVMLSMDQKFSVELSKKIVRAKINNQGVILRRYKSESDVNKLYQIPGSKKSIDSTKTTEQLMGFEGIAAKEYFEVLADIIDPEFKFQGRSRRPAVDPFNAMLNYGYALLTKEIRGNLENRGLNPYIGFLHSDKDGHTALASDMIEEWRAVIVDSVVLSMINGHEVFKDGFTYEDGACLMKTETLKLLTAKFERKMFTETKYLSYIEKPTTFRKAIGHQCECLVRAIENRDVDAYSPIYIR